MSDSFSQNGIQTSICVRNKLHCLLQAAAEGFFFFSIVAQMTTKSLFLHLLLPSSKNSLRMKVRCDAIRREIQTRSSEVAPHFLVIVCRYPITVGTGEQTQDKLPSQQGLKWKLISVVGFHSKSRHLILDIIVKR